MIQLTAIVDGKRSVMLTGNSINEAADSCKDRFGSRFQGFEPIQLETVAKSKWAEYRARQVTRDELEDWLKEQEDEQEIRAMFNAMRAA